MKYYEHSDVFIGTVKPLKRQSWLQQTTSINIFSLFFREIRLDVLSESSAIHMKNQALFSSKDKKKIKMSSAAIFVWRFKG